MKHLILGSALLFSASNAQAQAAAGGLFSPRRIVKTNLVGYANLAVNLNYEQKVGTKTSVGLLAGYKLPTVIHVKAIGTIDGERQTYTGDVEPEGVFLNPYFRYYTKETFKGFYVEAFLRYFNYKFLLPYDYEKRSDGRNIRANADGKASAFGGGLALGAQFPLGPRVYMDINIGYGMAVGNARLETNDPNLELEDYRTIQRNIEKYQDDEDIQVFLLGEIVTDPKAGSTDTKAWADFNNKLFPLLRGGISIGYAF
ncbi:MAG TPA: DUF3575 domain-containing protein [Flavobacteriales bacterium]|nr:DUF3575 domain-containing protein [Flavobacteriales bacterium]